MQMKLQEYNARFPGRSRPVPAEYAGEWVGWNQDRTEILAHGGNMSEVRAEAIQRGCPRPILQKIPLGPFVGGT